MARTIWVKFRASEKEYESVKNSAKVRGFLNTSSFLRTLALERDFWLEKKVQEIYYLVEELVKNQKDK